MILITCIKGTVHYINGRYIAVLTDNGYAVLRLEQGDVSNDDKLLGSLDALGHHYITNETVKSRLSVNIEAIHLSKQQAQEMIHST